MSKYSAFATRTPDRPDTARRTGMNGGANGSVFGTRVAPVTSRKSRKVAGWTSNIAGPEYIAVPTVRRVATDQDLRLAHPVTIQDVTKWEAFTRDSAATAHRIVTSTPMKESRREILRDQITARLVYVTR